MCIFHLVKMISLSFRFFRNVLQISFPIPPSAKSNNASEKPEKVLSISSLFKYKSSFIFHTNIMKYQHRDLRRQFVYTFFRSCYVSLIFLYHTITTIIMSIGWFFNCSVQISVLKRNTFFNQRGSFVH